MINSHEVQKNSIKMKEKLVYPLLSIALCVCVYTHIYIYCMHTQVTQLFSTLQPYGL